MNGIGDVLILTRKMVETMVLVAGDEQMLEVRLPDRIYRAYTWQVRNMLVKWPWKKAGVWICVSTANERLTGG